MSCNICGRNSCTESFHSIEEQTDFEDRFEEMIEKGKKLMHTRIDNKMYDLSHEWVEIDGEDVAVYKADDVKQAIIDCDY